MTRPQAETSAQHCVTCADEGTVMRVIELRDGNAVCADELRRRHRVAVELIDPVAVGDEVLVHAGVAIKHLGTPQSVGSRG
jgi:hydrogenase maturation factor